MSGQKLAGLAICSAAAAAAASRLWRMRRDQRKRESKYRIAIARRGLLNERQKQHKV